MRIVRPGVLRAVIVTSIVWLLIDVVVLFYYLDSGRLASTTRRQSLPVRGDRLTVREIPESFQKHEKKEVIDVPQARVLLSRKPTLDPLSQRKLDKLLSMKSFQSPEYGENGAGVVIPTELTAEKDKRFAENQFNVMASELISVNRSLPDYRSSQCQVKTYPLDLPKTSIIIVFHNEAWTTLLRTLHSVINRSPHHLLEEIILIDDLSDRDFLKEPLDEYIKRFPIQTRITHLKQRSGLIRARLTGSEMARGSILLFLDAHVEVTQGWLEPLLERVAGDKKRVVAPIIDVISDDTFEYVTASDTTWGGFNWHLNFRWYPVPKREMLRRNGDHSSPIQTPTIAGGLFAIDKEFFYDIGSYDEGMQVWGGENLEISFRVWMCGGLLEIHPCSRVGHVFRKQTPYTFPGGTAKVIHHNAARTAEVWMDEYKQFFYKMVPSARHVDPGDLSSRQRLRVNLQCKSFEWYLRNIYPEAPVPYDFKSLGAIFNKDSKLCLDTMGKKDGPIGLQPCHGSGGNQAWSLTGRGEVRSDDLCLSTGSLLSMDNLVRIERCNVASANPKHYFKYDPQNGQLIHLKSNRCLSILSDKEAGLLKCDYSPEQIWSVEGYVM
ncbi:Polypeptide N-acetylgalactosaminyltransferase 3 [Parelaphostrongylus tenuis]|uniref:Polypeptide N-acetylgalactosaminyltransferase n=1 Tax=Parelaphostrongylus tenuis TaxID=148309 RepID=A0AAD5MRR3_PARTN|nr:Polypeptide N-acetylgalactosaminyltransferase 3 [Parelaphostrongylus tenuis]